MSHVLQMHFVRLLRDVEPVFYHSQKGIGKGNDNIRFMSILHATFIPRVGLANFKICVHFA